MTPFQSFRNRSSVPKTLSAVCKVHALCSSPSPTCVFDAIAGTACCLENMCLSLVQLLQLPDCPANIVQDASRYRFCDLISFVWSAITLLQPVGRVHASLRGGS
jgi:hypothetical protein